MAIVTDSITVHFLFIKIGICVLDCELKRLLLRAFSSADTAFGKLSLWQQNSETKRSISEFSVSGKFLLRRRARDRWAGEHEAD